MLIFFFLWREGTEGHWSGEQEVDQKLHDLDGKLINMVVQEQMYIIQVLWEFLAESKALHLIWSGNLNKQKSRDATLAICSNTFDRMF